MRFLIITHVDHKLNGNDISAYSPYVREMNIWLKHVDEVTLVAPKSTKSKGLIDLSYKHNNLFFKQIPSIQFTSIKEIIVSLFKIPQILFTIIIACRKTDHIHLRCPGNIGLIGCIVQVFFSKKTKTAKYAGNWDPAAVNQPISYRFQKWILSNTFLTKNISTLVYGDWQNNNKNIKSFFTASFTNQDKEMPKVRDYLKELKFVFLGSLVESKRPLLAIQIVEILIRQGKHITLDIYGDGILKLDLQKYIVNYNLEKHVRLLGNRNQTEIKQSLKKSHFILLPSKSEGWPKAIAEAMFYGTIPVVTSISCVPYILDYGNRGILIEPNLEKATCSINKCLNDTDRLEFMSKKASEWSQRYTLDVFENEIIKLLKQ